MTRRLFCLTVFALVPTGLQAAPPSYAKDVRPFFARYCIECHSGTDPDGELNLETYKSLVAGGTHGPVLTPGKPDASRIVRMVEGKKGPRMPPKKARQPKPEEVALLRAWVAAGAKDDGAAVKVAVPNIRPKAPVAPPVTALAYHPGGKVLLAAGRGKALAFDAATGDLLWKLGGQNDRVTALAFSRDGHLLAVASSTAGKAHQVRLYPFVADRAPMPAEAVAVNRHDDIIYDLAFSPDGKLLASCGYDRLIRLWDVSAAVKKEVRVLKDHSDAVYGLSFSPDGKLLASGAADRAVKVWDVATGTRLYTLGEPTDWVYAVAWSPDSRHLAAAGVDRSIRVWEVSAAGGKVVHSVFAHEGPVLRLAYAGDGKALYSLSEDRTAKSWDSARMVERTVYPRQPETVLSLAVRPDGRQLALGRFDGAVAVLDAATGKTATKPLPIKPKPPVPERRTPEVEPNDSPRTAQKVTLPLKLEGRIGRAGDVDYYRFEAKAGQEVGVQVLAATIGSKLDPVLELSDAAGNVVAESGSGLLGYTCPRAGVYALGIRDRQYRGGGTMHYQLNVGPLPIITGVFPLGVQRGTEAEIHLEGVNLGKVRSVRIKAPANAAPGSRLPVTFTTPHGKPLGNPSVVVGEFPDAAAGGKDVHDAPFTANGRIATPGATTTWRFRAHRGRRLLLEVEARRLGSPLDSTIEILDARGRVLPRATLRCQARTYTVFRDHDSAGSGIRIEAWSELAVNDFLLAGEELIRIRQLPRNPDDDCQFFSAGGRRRGYLGTTPTFHSMGQPLYKVSIHPPGTTFPPNGLPVVTLYYRNDDGGGAFGKDSRLVFDPPADGVYQVRVGDARGQGGPHHAYRLTIRPPRPDFTVSFSPTAPAVSKGGAAAVTVSANRVDEYDGPIAVQLLNLPPGFSAPAATIPEGENSTSFALFAETSAAVPAKTPPLKLVARARIDGKEVVREAAGALPRVIEPGDIVTTTDQAEVTVRPGGEVRVTVRVERRNGFKGRIPLDVRGLPHGVRVLDVGLNGILVTEHDTSRTFVVHAEPWVKPRTLPFVVVARSERKGKEYAAKSVLLRVNSAGGSGKDEGKR